MSGGDLVAEVLERHGVRFLFTLCGGHIAPILVSAEKRGIRVIDTRHEATAVFAADAAARLTGISGVAAVTAGPGVTNTITAIRNAQLAQSPLVLLGGATAGILKGRGALQDIDQIALLREDVKWSATARRVRDIPPLLTTAFAEARRGVPGPVFLELPVDTLYEENVVREWFGKSLKKEPKTTGARLQSWYVRRYLERLFRGSGDSGDHRPQEISVRPLSEGNLSAVARRLAASNKPLLLLGSQVTSRPQAIDSIVRAIERIGAPIYLSGMARGLLGSHHPLQMRHRRRAALREADFVLLAGVPADFRLDYGRDIPNRAFHVAVNFSAKDVKKNRRPDVAFVGDPGNLLIALAARIDEAGSGPSSWIDSLRTADDQRQAEISASSHESCDWINPLALCQSIEEVLGEQSTLVADGGDFVSTASYIVRPRSPLSWLDPGPFGTLGVGAGFALGAALSKPESEIWILYGDGSLGFSLTELDTFARHRIPVIAVVGNDGCWTQIHREQIEILGAGTGCGLARTDYHVAAKGLGARGLLVRDSTEVVSTLAEAKRLASEGHPVLVNAWIGTTDFRKGSISM
jgi:acetolactate synthase-like protein